MDTPDLTEAVPAPAAEPSRPDSASAPGTEGRPFPLGAIAGGLATLVVFAACLGFWLTLAPIEGAVISPGIVNVASYRKQVQHLEGGIVETIFVREGDHVDQGQLLIQLRDVQQASELAQLEGQYLEAQAIVARLLAERSDAATIDFPPELTTRADEPAIATIIMGQEKILESHQSLSRDRRSVLEQKIAQAQAEIKGLSGQIDAGNRQRELILEELAQLEGLLAKKLTAKSPVLALQGRLAETEGQLSAHEAEIARTEQAILETRLQMSEARAEELATVTEQLRSERARLFDLSQRIIAARDVLRRTKIVSPIDGIVVNLQIHTHDGVIAPGQSILEVVPVDDELVIEAFVDPDDIDEVEVGLPADIQLTSLSRRKRLPIHGVVAHVSADRLTDAQTGRPYYRARIEPSHETGEAERSMLMAGMGAEVFIRTGARTPLDYLLSPITNALQFGLREN